MFATVGWGYSCWIPLREACVQAPMRGKFHYASSAQVSFFKFPTLQLAGEDNSNTKLHLTITSDRVDIKTSNLDLWGKKTWGICLYGPLHSSGPLFPRSFKTSQSIFIDTDSLMRASHFYFMYQPIPKRANFRLYFERGGNRHAGKRITFLTVTISFHCFQMGMTSAVSIANCEFWPFFTLRHQACYIRSICRP